MKENNERIYYQSLSKYGVREKQTGGGQSKQTDTAAEAGNLLE
jgi:hypothetical protein